MNLPDRRIKVSQQNNPKRVRRLQDGGASKASRQLVFNIIRCYQPISRINVARLLGIMPSTVSLAVEQLRREGWIIERQGAVAPRGRRPISLNLNPDVVAVVADIQLDQMTVAVVDLNGQILSQIAFPFDDDPNQGMDQLAEGMHRMMRRYPNQTFLGVGVSLPGRVDPETKMLVFAPRLPWHGFDIREYLERDLGLPVELDNDATASLLSLLWVGELADVRDAVLVSCSEGVRVSILANGQFISGKRGLAGEFGHISIDPHGPLCSCGQKGCWEMFASSCAAINHYAALEPTAPRPTVEQLLYLAEAGDASALTTLTTQATYLGRGLLNIIKILSPDVIYLSGGLTESWDRFGQYVSKELARITTAGPLPRLVPLGNPAQARLTGAAVLAFQPRVIQAAIHVGRGAHIRPTPESFSAQA